MKKIYNYFLIGIIIICLTESIFMALLLKKDEPRIKINRKGIDNITIINNQTRTAKEIDKWMDLDAICKLFNSTDMSIIQNYDKAPERQAGGISYTFIINYNSSAIDIGYRHGNFLINNGNIYRINSTEFEEFWNLDYKERNYRYPGFIEPEK